MDKQKIITIDIGNTNIVMGVFRSSILQEYWRIKTEKTGVYHYLEHLPDALVKQKDVTAVVIATVVPDLRVVFEQLCQQLYNLKPIFVDASLDIGLKIWYTNPRQVGADRIANAIAAKELYSTPAIIIDFGTALTFDVVSLGGEYLGGIIFPGMGMASEMLHEKTALLPWVHIIKTENILGRDTQSSIQSGVYWGYVGLVKYLLNRLKKEVFAGFDADVNVIATGGYVSYFLTDLEEVRHFDVNLTLKGLMKIYEILKSKNQFDGT
ncbi:MAG: type III pantothenate kinase [Chlamydiota bacterium]|nr:type III pantothenate kinase [Chlamydiota bacterium]